MDVNESREHYESSEDGDNHCTESRACICRSSRKVNLSHRICWYFTQVLVSMLVQPPVTLAYVFLLW